MANNQEQDNDFPVSFRCSVHRTYVFLYYSNYKTDRHPSLPQNVRKVYPYPYLFVCVGPEWLYRPLVTVREGSWPYKAAVPIKVPFAVQSHNGLFVVRLEFDSRLRGRQIHRNIPAFHFVMVETKKKISNRNTQSINGDIETSGSSSLFPKGSFIRLSS